MVRLKETPGVTDPSTGLPVFKEFVWFVYKVSGVMCSVSVCEYYSSIEGWIHSQRRSHLLPWDIDLVIDETVDDHEEVPEV